MARNMVKQDEDLRRMSNFVILKRLFKYLKKHKFRVFLVIMLLIFEMIVSLINPVLMKTAIDKNIRNGDIKGLLIIGLLMVSLNFMAMMASKVRIVKMASVTNDILVTIRHELYSHIQKLSFSFFDSRPVGKILARVIGDVNSLQDLFNNSVTNFIPQILTVVCVGAMMFYLNHKLALASMTLLPLLVIGLFSIETLSRRRWQNFRRKRSTFNAYTHEDFSGIKVVQEFANEDKTSSIFFELVKDMMGSFVHAVKLNDLFWPMVDASYGLGAVILYYFSAKLIGSGLTIGTIIAFTMYIGMFWRPILDISNFYNSLVMSFASAERIFEIMDIEPDIVDIKNAIKMPKIKGAVEFKNVTFSYDDGNVVLDNVSFKVNPGEIVALVGPTGAGKTTIVNLISRFYDPSKGAVLIDGKDIKHVELESLRSQMGIMLQDTFLFSATIKENIRYGKLDATDEEIIAAAKAVNAHDFIMKMEKGYDTEVNERGSRLSVGQRQLISFARALLANPRILILDEATSNIDTQTERLVQRGIKRLLTGRTSFVIAHRLSTIRDADRIMVVDGGRIVEVGTHDELMNLRGLYYDLYMSQYRFLSEGA
ncbi:multidrug ABC transporter ATP-binding protein [Thermoanaerobacterium thermosaccharolyticum]|uniref:Multidrug ABC transporter ATP-binding protein n=1 Tax=Thermoanaerobacterium thermosaccharolyticum TaxID=1517 RepID=A0A231VD07_THETR|nr:ABC transporter ATP-binding protein [Thermoanaerobacterium thermosaccharolyticum]AST57234.1 multidrug ABC transporter ATP-binding protein [Thermoanaerobacterium thermosaccharolyticum]KAA5805763.1 ABC transporter ATP-binding protein [Thermoanaerobacterium thermosaccharolyticum]MBE0069754.1 ABC transporter ATP-binding protein [Thermoanaerobacterium thermosaccharolyticum]MBE0229481.1 ABC transporter ATP-binding protein [Thermoanaerobacterium thermosaccharolyticum]OXT06054.1 multidrug ABC trans